MLKKALKIFGLLTILMIIGQSASAQSWNLIMEVVVTNDGKKMSGATVELRKGGSLVQSFTTDAKGAVDVPVPAGGNYEITISGNGLIKKKVAVNTANVPPEEVSEDMYFPAEVNIFPKVAGLDYKILDEPIGIIRYDSNLGGFDADLDYTKRRKAALDKLTEDYERQKAEEAKQMAAKQKEYDAAVKAADKAFGAEQWELAEQEYKKAAAIMPTETYPSFQLAELETKLIKIRETNAKYDEAIKLADEAFASKDYQRAIAEYKRAGGYKPDEAYPQTKLKETQALLADQVKKDQTYLAAIERGDNALKISDLNTAKAAFEEATAAKPEESYPKNKLAEINDILGKQQAKEEEYQNAIKAADEALAAKDYGTAKSSYQAALQVKPTESYPQEQITKVDALIAEAAQRDQNYLAAIEKGDNALTQNDLQSALTAFNEAVKIKPEEEYPANKIKEINDLIAKSEAQEKEYQDKIKEADKLLAAKSYPEAKTAFEAASNLKPTESYPKEKISEIDGILAAEAEKEEKYKSAIAAGDQAMQAEDYTAAKNAYTEASGLKPDEKYPQDQLASIGTILVKMEENKAQYDEAIKNGDEAFAADDLDAAVKFYEEAKGLNSEESYPQSKLDEIAEIVAKRAEQEKAYNDAIASADAAMNENKLEDAKSAYTKAKELKPNESYPTEQIAKIDGMLADAAQLEEEYNSAIKAGDAAMAAADYATAISSFKEATAKKPEEAYPKEKIAEAEGLIKEGEEKEAQYAAAIKTADKAFDSENYEEAKTAYQEALGIKEDPYPKERIAAAEEKLASLAAEKAAAEKLEADYQAALADGDSKFGSDDLDGAVAAYQQAASLKPDEKVPQEKITEVENRRKALEEEAKLAEEKAAAEKLEADYQAALADGDSKFGSEDFGGAIAAYQQASSLKPEEKLPQEKIAEVEAKQKELADQKAEEERLAALQKEYDAKIAEADAAYGAKNYKEARTAYQAALALKGEESYPKEKVDEINGVLADAAEQDELYAKAIEEADKLFGKEDYEASKLKYQEASSIKSEESYPKDKVAEIDSKLAELAAAAEAIRVQKEQEDAQRAKYDGLMSEGDALSDQSEYEQAISKYEAALAVIDEQDPKDKIAEMKTKIQERDAQMAEAAKAERDAKYQALIEEADGLFSSEDFAGATAKYNDALGVKDEQYPKDQLAAIQQKEAELASAAEQAAKEAEYQKYVEEGDTQFEAENYSSALDKYNLALTIKEDPYPRAQVDKINAMQAEQAQAAEMAKKEAEYQSLLAEADAAFEANSLDEAESKYNSALAVLDKQYPKDQLQKISDRKSALDAEKAKLAAAAQIEENYKNIIAAADEAFNAQNYQQAKDKYNEALAIKPEESYPAQRIGEITGLLAAAEAENAKEANYQRAIATADAAMSSEDYEKAKSEYQSALAIKPNQAYPKEQIAKADQLMADAAARAEEIRLKREAEAQNEAAYQTAIAEGDQLYANKKYNEAINKYQLALGLNSSKTYPADQIEKIKQLQVDEEAEAERLAKEAADREKRYLEIISSANASFDKKDYEFAKREYEAALSMKPNESYPQMRINEINSIIRGNQLAEEKEKPVEEEIKIQSGPKSTVDGDAEAEIDRIYKEMWAKKNSDKNELVEEKREVIRKLREEDKEREESKRLNAIEQLENISISIAEQRKTADEIHLQNYETVQSNTETIVEKELELSKDSEKKRNEVMLEKDKSQENIDEYRKEKHLELVEGKKEAVEEDFDDELEFHRELRGVQHENIEALDEEYVQKDEDIRTFNKDRAEVNMNQNKELINKNEEEWKESVTRYNDGSYKRTDAEKEKIYQKDVDLREYNKERNDGYMEGYEVVKEKTKDNEEFIEDAYSDSDERRMAEQSKVGDIETDIRNQRIENKDKGNENYIGITEKTEALKDEKLSLDKESEERRMAQLEKEFYEGEDKPRQDPESANYPQGVSEKIIENDNGSTTIRRTKVEGTETNVYEKTLQPWGAVFYTKNGSNITKEAWDAESK